MAASYTLKVERAKKHIADANDLLKKRRPFRYVVETDYKAGERSIGAKRNEAVIADLGLIIGDIVHNLRTALDHRVWDLVSPHCTDKGSLDRIQFPFPKYGTKESIESTFKSRQIHRAPENVWAALEALKPYPGGNDNLVLLHSLDIIDKHKLPIPTADYTQFTAARIRTLVPDFPSGFEGMLTLGGNARDVVWNIPAIGNRHERRARGLGTGGEKEVPIPVDVVICEAPGASLKPLMPTLYALTIAVERALKDLSTL